MSTWYFVDQEQRRQGPVEPGALVQAYHRGDVDRDSLVWRDGLAQWAPLRDHLGELGFDADAPPPALADIPAGPIDTTDVVPAGFVRRFVAVLIDGIIVGIAYNILFTVVFMAGAVGLAGVADLDEDSIAGLAAVFMLPLLFYPIMSLAYFGLMESSALQATVGKMALGIKVTDLQGRRLTRARAAGRWLASVLSYLTLYIGFLMAAFTKRKRALHDFVAGTQVVDRWAYTDQPGRQKRAPHGCLVAVLVGFVLVSLLLWGMLAAVAVPAYSDYLARSRLTAAVMEARALQPEIDDFVVNTDRCPRDAAELELGPPNHPAIASLVLGESEAGMCMIEIELAAVEGTRGLAGERIRLSRDSAGDWYCTSPMDDRKYLPSDCY